MTDGENKLMIPEGEIEGINGDIGIDIPIILYIKEITNKNPQYAAGKSTQYATMT